MEMYNTKVISTILEIYKAYFTEQLIEMYKTEVIVATVNINLCITEVLAFL